MPGSRRYPSDGPLRLTKAGDADGASRRVGSLASRAGLYTGPVDRILRQQRTEFDYDFVQLVEWKLKLLESSADIQWLDIVAKENIIEIGSSTAAGRAALRKLAEEVGVPGGAVRVVRAPEVQSASAAPVPLAQQPFNQLDQWVRPTPAGVKIRKPNGQGCTYGGAVSVQTAYGQLTGLGLTNSHCSDFIGSGAGSSEEIYQPDGLSGVFGYEIYDPEFFEPPYWYYCSPGHLCRLSDSAIFHIGGYAGNINAVAWPTPVNANGDIFWPGQLTKPIKGTWYYPYRSHIEGDVWTMVSASQGLQEDLVVIRDCVNTETQIPMGTFGVLCAHVLQHPGQDGDSGSPVVWDAPALGGVLHVGIVFGSSNEFGGSLFYSDWWGINGDLQTIDPAFTARSCDGTGGAPGC